MMKSLLILVIILMAAAAAGENLDRIAVTVGTHVIPQSEVILALRVAAFIDEVTPDFSGPQKRKAADRLVDEYLVLTDAAATRAPVPTPADVEPVLAPIRARYASDTEYRAALERAGITEPQLKAHLLAGLQMLRYTDLRFRGEVQITEENLREFFNTFVAESGQKNPAEVLDFESSRDQVEKLLIDQRTSQALDRWLGIARNETQILYRDAAFK
ncbi:MAG TPA: hypothetical protein VK687_02070 [Bryobacteraceae bacterium]|nr:hypothetical protein [Bryobacteraceae bacterium]